MASAYWQTSLSLSYAGVRQSISPPKKKAWSSIVVLEMKAPLIPIILYLDIYCFVFVDVTIAIA